MGEAAATAATGDAVAEGAVGAGTGATVGKLFGLERAMKSGIGSWTVELEGRYAGVKVAALAAVNAVGDIRDPATRTIVAGARTARNSMEFADSARAMKAGLQSGFSRANTTLVVVATNARLNKVEATKLSQLAQLGVARAIDPVNTMSDGDVTIALSIGNAAVPLDVLGVAAAEATAEAILRAVREARTLGGVPGLKA
jgi:L-aminopeptidase/D-esterase-like protein